MKPFLIFGSLLIVLLIGGCGGSGPQLTSISVTPAKSSIVLGGSQQLAAIGTYSNGTTQNIAAQVTWSSSDDAVAIISNAPATAGLAQGVARGSTTIFATVSGITGSSALTVKTLASIAVTPTNPSIELLASQGFTAAGTYSDGSTADVTSMVTWNSASNAVATISNAAGASGMVQAVALGETTISATSSTISGTTTATVTPPPTVLIPPNNVAVNYTDNYTLALTATSASFSRPLIDGQGFNLVAPGARIRFQSTAPYIVVHLSYTNLVTRRDVYNGTGVILVDGTSFTTFDEAQISAGTPAQNLDIPLVFATAASRLVEIILPYDASVSFLGIDMDSRYPTLSQVPARSPSVMLALGDSITQGFYAQQIENTWPVALSQLKGWQLVDGGYGGRTVVPADVALLAPSTMNPKVITYLIGYNDFAAQEPLSTFIANYTAYLNNLRAKFPSTLIYCITPLWTSNTAADYGGSIEIESYRQQIRDALAAINNPLNVLVEGASLISNSGEYFQDGIHPNDAGTAQLTAALASAMSP